MTLLPIQPRKPKALPAGSRVAVIAPASPADPKETQAGIEELRRLEFKLVAGDALSPEGYFAGSLDGRLHQFHRVCTNAQISGIIALRGGYGSNYLLADEFVAYGYSPKVLLGYSDLTSLQTYLWQYDGWITFLGPMLAAGLNHGAGVAQGYDEASLLQAIRNTTTGWDIALQAEIVQSGVAEGRLLGGCLTILQATMGTPWELDTFGAILVLEDTAMKPYQVDRALMHLLQAEKFRNVRGFLLGDFPNCDPPAPGSPTVREVCERILAPLGVPIVYGAPIGHTQRAMLTLPLGVHAKLNATGEGTLQVLEPAVVE